MTEETVDAAREVVVALRERGPLTHEGIRSAVGRPILEPLRILIRDGAVAYDAGSRLYSLVAVTR